MMFDAKITTTVSPEIVRHAERYNALNYELKTFGSFFRSHDRVSLERAYMSSAVSWEVKRDFYQDKGLQIFSEITDSQRALSQTPYQFMGDPRVRVGAALALLCFRDRPQQMSMGYSQLQGPIPHFTDGILGSPYEAINLRSALSSGPRILTRGFLNHLNALQRLGEYGAVLGDRYKDLLGNREAGIRALACELLTQATPHSWPAVPELLAIALRDRSIDCRIKSLRALKELGPLAFTARDSLKELVSKTKSEDIRLAACCALRTIDPDSTLAIREYFNSDFRKETTSGFRKRQLLSEQALLSPHSAAELAEVVGQLHTLGTTQSLLAAFRILTNSNHVAEKVSVMEEAILRVLNDHTIPIPLALGHYTVACLCPSRREAAIQGLLLELKEGDIDAAEALIRFNLTTLDDGLRKDIVGHLQKLAGGSPGELSTALAAKALFEHGLCLDQSIEVITKANPDVIEESGTFYIIYLGNRSEFRYPRVAEPHDQLRCLTMQLLSWLDRGDPITNLRVEL